MVKVSVIIPTHNRLHLLPRAIQSVLNQSFQDFEIIVVDDGIEKSAEDAVRQFSDERIKYFKSGGNLGGAVARNIGIKNSQGEYIAFLDDDDGWAVEKLQKQVKAFEENKENIGVVFCGVKAFDSKGNFLYERLPDESGVVNSFERLLHKCYIWTSSIMMKRSLAEDGFIFDENLKKNQEWDLLLRSAKKIDFFAINESLTRLNILDENDHMGGVGNIKNMIDGFVFFIDKHYNDYRQQKKSLSLRYFRLAELYFLDKQFIKMRRAIFQAWVNNPFNLIYLKHLLVSFLGESVYYFFKNKKNV